jgi:Phage minor structural protein GP20
MKTKRRKYMEFLKALFEAGALTFEQFVEAVTKAGIKLANLADGGYVDKQKLEDKVSEVKALKDQLADANKAIEAAKELDVEGIKKQADEWKIKCEKVEEDAKKKIYSMQISAIVEKEFLKCGGKESISCGLSSKRATNRRRDPVRVYRL